MKTIALTITMTLLLGINLISASVQSDIETANKAGKVVFLVVTEKGITGTDQAVEIAKKAQAQYSKSEVLQMDRSDTANSEFVAKYRLSGATLPLILVIATNGIVAAGFTGDKMSPELLVNAIPSPKKSDVQMYLSEGKSVFVVVTNKSMKSSDNMMNTCQQACIEMENNAKMIEISMDDSQEKQFLTELKVDMTATAPVTYVINSKGQITGSFGDDVNSATLVATAKKVTSGCCSGGKTCGPTKK